jgi:hypothetical protein
VTKSTRETLFTAAYLVVGVAAAIVVGYLTYKQRFSHYPQPLLPILVAGISGALLYAAVQMRGFGVTLLMLVMLYLAHVAMAPPIRVSSLVGAAIFYLPVGTSMIVSSYVMKRLQRVKFGKFLLMAIIVGLGYAVMVVLFLLRSHADVRPGLIADQAFLGAKLGAGLGIAFELVDFLGPRPWNRRAFGKSAD